MTANSEVDADPDEGVDPAEARDVEERRTGSSRIVPQVVRL
ncbi:hypothetical protein [Novosphingobium sp.]|nr:hypothetical protein [Novosphingobium sp.]